MILDYVYNKNKRIFSISYIKENGQKSIMNFNVERFKSYYKTPSGKFDNWDGCKCDVKWTDKPSTFELKTYMMEMDEKYRKVLEGKVAPKLYTFDIETEISDEFPEPGPAKFPITSISIVNSDCDIIVLGTKKVISEQWIQEQIHKYLNDAEYWHTLNMKLPTFKYMKFLTEREMLEYFLKNIVAKVSVIAGWNSILFDWQYIQNRIKNYYSDLNFACCSCNYTMNRKNYQDMKGDKVQLQMPSHTLVLDMMDVIGTFDMVVMPIKESLSLDYISKEAIGMRKIKYEGSLQDLYERDYDKYVFYNAIDSVLVQLLDKKFKTLQNIYVQALYCKEKIGSTFSKIAVTEALFFNYFYENNIKVVYEEHDRERGTLVGAYVKEPIPGKYNFMCCNDFASLYPSTIITCNLSVENYLGKDFTHEELEFYRKDPNYFVSVNGCVYKNDKDYAFKVIQSTLKANRNVSKYLSKQLDALVMKDVDGLLDGKTIKCQTYPDNIVESLKNLGYEIISTNDLHSIDLNTFKRILGNEITYLGSYEQGMKLLGNSGYGGSSHVSFFWFNLDLANDITGEARNLIHKMEHHIPDFWRNNWTKLTDLHKKLGIALKSEKELKEILESTPVQWNDPDAYHNHSYVVPVYGDTDSIYTSYEPLLKTIKGYESMSLDDKRDIIARINTEFMDQHNKEYIDAYYDTRFAKSVHAFELETIALSGVWLNVKKRYAQLLLWKDGKTYDLDELPLKVKGLEIAKSSYPKQARNGLKHMVRYLLEDEGEGYLLQRLNVEMMKMKEKFMQAPLEDICGNMGVQGYTKYILDDTDPSGLKIGPKCPSNVRALGNYNWIRNTKKLPGDPLYGGKMKWYVYVPCALKKKGKKNVTYEGVEYFAFQSGSYPKWADQYAPVNKTLMFEKMMIDPFNRIIESSGIGKLQSDGSIQMGLF